MIRKPLAALMQLGPLPDEAQEIADGFLEQYDELLQKITPPLTLEEAQKVILLLPRTACFGMEWTLVHLLETMPGWPIPAILTLCPSETWRKQLKERAGIA